MLLFLRKVVSRAKCPVFTKVKQMWMDDGMQFLGPQRFELTEADRLTAVLITGYELAIKNGMEPMHALSTLLKWIAEEMARIRDQTPENMVAS